MKIEPPDIGAAISPTRHCVHLRAKTMYIAGFAEPGNEAVEPPFYWCNRTLRELGPDGEFVASAPCSDAARPCHCA